MLALEERTMDACLMHMSRDASGRVDACVGGQHDRQGAHM